MRVTLTVFFAAISLYASSQSCSCLDDYHFIKDHIEKNHAGFNKKIVSPEEPAAAVEAFLKTPAYLNTDAIVIDEKALIQELKDKPGIEGIYYTPDSTY